MTLRTRVDSHPPILFVLRFQILAAICMIGAPIIAGGRFGSLFVVEPSAFGPLLTLTLWTSTAIVTAASYAADRKAIALRWIDRWRFLFIVALALPIVWRVLWDSPGGDVSNLWRYTRAGVTGVLVAAAPFVGVAFSRWLLDQRFWSSFTTGLPPATKGIVKALLEQTSRGGFRRLFLFVLLTYMVVGVLLQPPLPLATSALLFVLLIGTSLLLLVTALAAFGDARRIPVLLILIAMIAARWMVWPPTHRYTVTPMPAGTPLVTIETFLDNHEITTPIVIASSGGGTRAATWAATVVRELQAGCRDFLPSVRFVSAVSGGSLAWLYLADILKSDRTASPSDLQRVVDRASTSALPDIGWALAYPLPLRRWFFFTGTGGQDRAWALEQAWRRDWHWRYKRLSDWRRAVAEGRMPPIALNAALTDVGLPLVLGNVDVLWPEAGLAVTDSQADIDLVTAVRLSATFPLVTPEARADGPTHISSHVTDGGYFDNTGNYIGMLGAGDILNTLSEHQRAIFIDIYSTSEDESIAESRRLGIPPNKPLPAAGWLEPIRAVFSTRREHERILTQLMGGVVRQMARQEEKDLVTFRFPLYALPGSWELTRRERDIIDDRASAGAFKDKVACVCSALRAKNDCEQRFDEGMHFP
jgi:hypothetical protein